MAEKLDKICNKLDTCKFSKIPYVRKRFCYEGGGCPEEYSPIIKEIIQNSLIEYKEKTEKKNYQEHINI